MAGVRVLRYRTPLPLKIFLGLAGLCCFGPLLLVVSRPDQTWPVLQGMAMGAVLLTAVYVGHAGYRVGYGDARLHMRGPNPWNRRLRWPTTTIALDDIACIEIHASTGAPPASRYIPGDYLAVIPVQPADGTIHIRPDALHEGEMVELLVWLTQHRPDLMPDAVVDRLRDAGHPV